MMSEIDAALRKRRKKIGDVVCGGVRLGKHWKHLGGLRVPRFECTIAEVTLMVDGEVLFYDEYGKQGAEPNRAMYHALKSPKWSWK